MDLNYDCQRHWLSSLPAELWNHISSYLSIRDRAHLEQTSKHMSNFAWRSLTSLDLRNYWNCFCLNVTLISRILEKCPNIETLRLPGDPRLACPLTSLASLKRLRTLTLPAVFAENEDYRNLVPTLSRLTSFSLHYVSSPQVFRDIGQYLTQLRELKLCFVRGIGRNRLGELTTLCGLWHLNLAGFKNLEDEEMTLIPHFSHLKELNLAFGDFTEIGIGYLTTLTSLQHLNLRYNDHVLNDGFCCLSQLTALTYLSLSNTHCRAKVFVTLTVLTNLRTLCLSECDDIDDFALNHIFNNFTSLIRFQRHGPLQKVTSESLCNISKLSNLRQLEIRYSTQKCVSWEAHLPCFSNLTTLHLVSDDPTNDRLPLEFILKLTKLKSLRLDDFHWPLFDNSINVSAFSTLSAFTSLKYLSLRPVAFAYISPYISLLTSLQVLHIEDRSSKVVDVLVLSNLTALTFLTAFGRNFDVDDALARLKQRLPYTKIN
jgi:hypothetical protein